jgi:hypothetical protein
MAVNLASMTGGKGRWVAAQLSDGKSDGAIYDTKADAIRHQLHEYQCAYVKVPADGMQAEHATRYLEVHRKLYAKGMRIADPDRSPIMPHTLEEHNIFMRSK